MHIGKRPYMDYMKIVNHVQCLCSPYKGGGGQMKSREAVVLRIMELIEDQDITVNYLSTISAVPPTTLKNILYGNTETPGIVTIAKICDGLGITLNEFFSSDIFKSLEQEIE